MAHTSVPVKVQWLLFTYAIRNLKEIQTSSQFQAVKILLGSLRPNLILHIWDVAALTGFKLLFLYCAYPRNDLRQFLGVFFVLWCFICLINKISWRACKSSDLQIYPERLWLAIWGDLGIFVLKFSQVTIKIRHVLENSDSLPVTCLLLPLQTIWYPAPLKGVTDSEGWVHTGNMNTRAQWLLPRSSEELNGRICFGFV